MKKSLAILLSLSMVVMSLSGCSSGKSKVTGKDTKNEVVSGQSDSVFGSKGGGTGTGKQMASNLASGDSITLMDLATKYGVSAGVGTQVGDFGVSPIYNVANDAKFTFHFNSKVDPFQAVTVHTDRACGLNSMISTSNRAYFTEDGGVDIIVRNWLKPVLDSKDRLDHIEHDESWGHAGKYYISVNYDVDATIPTKLDEPIIIPFTLKSASKVPQVNYRITTDGEFVLTWNDCDADSYRIYAAYKDHYKREGTLEREYGYQIRPELVEVVPGNVTEYRLKDRATNDMVNTSYNVNYQIMQNNIDDGAYFVTSVKDGKESDFGLEVSVYNFASQLPHTLADSSQFIGGKYDGSLNNLPQQVAVEMRDKSLVYYPINYRLLQFYEYTSGSGNFAVYFYTIPGTKLTGTVGIHIGQENPKDEIYSNYTFNAGLYETKLDLSKISDSDFPIISGVDNSDIDLTRVKEYSYYASVVYEQDALDKRVDLEAARILTDGEYTSDPNSIYVVDYNSEKNDLQKRKEQFGDIFSVENSKQRRGEQSNSETSSQTETTTERETEGATRSSGWDFVEDTTEEENSNSGWGFMDEPETTEVRQIEVETSVQETESWIEDNTEDIEITADNIIEEKIKDDNDKFQEAENIVLNTPEKYPVMANSMEEEYIARALIEQQEYIRLDVIPSLLDMDYLQDIYFKAKYQNPYILGVRGADLWIDDDQSVYLLPFYEYTNEEAAQKQEEIYQKVASVVSQIYTSSMSPEEKVEATWKYLEENTRYDTECCDYLEAHDFIIKGEYPYKDSSSVYGILCKGVGVCQSYSYAMIALLNQVDVNCIGVVGYMNKTMPHAWNAVELNGNWYQIDVTNNFTNSGFPYYLYTTSTDYAESMGYVPDNYWEIDTKLATYRTTDNSKEWYTANHMFATNDDELLDALVEGWKSSEYIVYGVHLGYDFDVTNEWQLGPVMEEFGRRLGQDNLITEEEAKKVALATVQNYLMIVKDSDAFFDD